MFSEIPPVNYRHKTYGEFILNSFLNCGVFKNTLTHKDSGKEIKFELPLRLIVKGFDENPLFWTNHINRVIEENKELIIK